jgi:hypothetical protein
LRPIQTVELVSDDFAALHARRILPVSLSTQQ